MNKHLLVLTYNILSQLRMSATTKLSKEQSVKVSLYVKGFGAAAVQISAAKKNFAKK